jgi:hypothetical protein
MWFSSFVFYPPSLRTWTFTEHKYYCHYLHEPEGVRTCMLGAIPYLPDINIITEGHFSPVHFLPTWIQDYFNEHFTHVSYSNFSSILLNNTVTPMIIQHQAMSYLSVPIPTSSSLTDVAKLPKYLLKSAFYDNLIYFRCGSKTFITIQITDKNRDDLHLECFDIFTWHRDRLYLKKTAH